MSVSLDEVFKSVQYFLIMNPINYNEKYCYITSVMLLTKGTIHILFASICKSYVRVSIHLLFHCLGPIEAKHHNARV